MTVKVSARMAHWGIRFVSLGFAVGFVWLSQPAVQARCGMYCVAAENGCAADEHYAYDSAFGTRAGDPHGCLQLKCDVDHPQCGAPLPAADLDSLENAATAGDRARVQSILDEHTTLTVNSERSAVQQLDCAGNVVAHIPMPSALIADLSASHQR